MSVGAQSTLGGAIDIFAKKYMYEKLPKFYIFARKINKIPEFYMIIAENIFPDLFFLRGARPSTPSPTRMQLKKTCNMGVYDSYLEKKFYTSLLTYNI